MPALSENARGPQSIQLSPESELPRLEKNYARAVAKWSQTGGPERVDTPAAEHGPALGARRNTVQLRYCKRNRGAGRSPFENTRASACEAQRAVGSGVACKPHKAWCVGGSGGGV